jgi:hypothetical protein
MTRLHILTRFLLLAQPAYSSWIALFKATDAYLNRYLQ